MKSRIPRTTLQSISDGTIPSVDRAAEICEALGLEFYIGPPREEKAPATQKAPVVASPVKANINAVTDQLDDLSAKLAETKTALKTMKTAYGAPSPASDIMDTELFEIVVDRVDLHLKKNKHLAMSPKKKAALYLAIYDCMIEEERENQDIDLSQFDNVIRLVQAG